MFTSHYLQYNSIFQIIQLKNDTQIFLFLHYVNQKTIQEEELPSYFSKTGDFFISCSNFLKQKNKRNAVNSTFLSLFTNAADRNRTGTGGQSRRILSHLVPTDFPRTSWYEMELRVPKNGDFLPARNSLNDKFLANSV